jgi:hypothetical protein
MATAQIRIDQAGHSTQVIGVAGRSRDNLETGKVVTLRNVDDSGVRSHRWRIIDQPNLASPVGLSNPNAATPTFTPVDEGTYLIELIVNEGRRGEVQRRLGAIRSADGTRVPAAGEQNEANWLDVTAVENPRGWQPDARLAQETALAGASFNDDSGQVTTTLAAISNQSIAEPLGLWNLDGDLVDEVTGGAGNDFVAGFDGTPCFELFQGIPGTDEKYGSWHDGETGIEATGGTNPGSKWNLDQDLTVMAWVKQDDYEAEGGDDDPYVAVTFANRSSSALGGTTSPPYRLGLFDRIANGNAAARAGYYETDGTTFVGVDHRLSGTSVKTPMGKWVHLCMTRIRNGADDNDVTLFVNGEQVDQLLAQNDANLPTSVDQRLQVGQGRGGTNGFVGTIHDVAIWDSELTPAEVRTMYQIGIGVAA